MGSFWQISPLGAIVYGTPTNIRVPSLNKNASACYNLNMSIAANDITDIVHSFILYYKVLVVKQIPNMAD